jgi:hypothetical protein
MMMTTEMDIETSVYYVHLTRLIAREDFIKFTRRESTKIYIGYISSSSSFLGSTAQPGPWPPPQNLAKFLGGLSTVFFFTG